MSNIADFNQDSSFTNYFNQLSIDDTLSNVPNELLHNDDEWIIDYNNSLGTGAQSVGIFRGEKVNGKIDNQSVPKEVAIKLIKNTQIGKHELGVLAKLKDISSNHKNIVKIFGYSFGSLKQEQDKQSTSKKTSQPSRDLYVYMEYMENYKNLLDYVEENGALSETEIKNITKQLISTLEELNEKHHIVHRDIKSSNVMFNKSNGNIKLIDFGVSKGWDNTSKYGTTVGSPLYIAPEVKEENSGKASSRSDIWSVGCTIIEIAGGDLTKRKDDIPINIPESLTNDCKNFIQNCLILESTDRPKAIDLMNHKFIKDNPIKIEPNILVVNVNDIENNNSIKDYITKSTTHLELIGFNKCFDHLKNELPTTVTSLSLPQFNQPISENSIPSHIKSLSITSFNHNLEEDSIPPTLLELILGEDFQFNDHGGDLPDTIKTLKCSYNFSAPLRKNNNIPKKVSTLVLDNYNQPIQVGSIPKTIHTLKLGSNYQKHHLTSLSNLPSSVFNLTLGVNRDQFADENQVKLSISNNNISNLITIINN